jgi:hypothetical protein
MKQLLCSILLLSSTIINAQKKIECTKSTINIDGNVIADYEGKGGMFSDKKIYIFSPNTKDTLMTILQSTINLDHPMVDNPPIVYLTTFYNPEKSMVYFTNPPGWGLVKNKKFLTILFNDNLPPLIVENKISIDAIKAFNEKNSFDVELIKRYINQMNDTILALKNIVPQRDKQKVFTYTSLGRNTLPKFYKSSEGHNFGNYEIKQDNVTIGILEKETSNSGGSFAKTFYNFYKKVSPFKIGEHTINYIPVATTEASPGITSSISSMPIKLKLIGLNTSIEVKPSEYNAAEKEILNVIVANSIL